MRACGTGDEACWGIDACTGVGLGGWWVVEGDDDVVVVAIEVQDDRFSIWWVAGWRRGRASAFCWWWREG